MISTSHCLLLCLWCFMSHPVMATTFEADNRSDNHQLITLQADHLPLRVLLTQICKTKNVQLSLNGTFSTEVSVLFEKLPLKQAILRLVSNNTRMLMITYADADNRNTSIIEKIVIYENDQPSPTKTIIDFGQSVEEQLDYLEYLASGPEHEAIPEIAKILSAKDGDVIVKQRAVHILTGFSSDEVAETLANGLSDKRPNIRGNIINALGQLKNQQSSLILAQVLFSEKDKVVRLLAVEHLTALESPAAKAFLQVAAKDSNQQIKREAQYALDVFKVR